MKEKSQVLFWLFNNCLQFRVHVKNDEARDLSQYLPALTESGKTLADFVAELETIFGFLSYGPGNGNSGGSDHYRIFVGNEYSMVIYVDLVESYKTTRTTTVDEMRKKLEKLGKKYGCDEISVKPDEHGGDNTECRFWWD